MFGPHCMDDRIHLLSFCVEMSPKGVLEVWGQNMCLWGVEKYMNPNYRGTQSLPSKVENRLGFLRIMLLLRPPFCDDKSQVFFVKWNVY